MDLKRYEAYVKAVEMKSMAAAGKELGYTASGIIRLVNALEGELGFPLLVRSASGVVPTPEGERLLPTFRQMCQLDDQVQSTAARIRGLAEGTLTIGALSTLSNFWLPAVLQAYHQKYPHVRVNIVGGSNASQKNLLEKNKIDCCVRHGAIDHYDWTPLGQQEIMVWAKKGHPVTRHSEVLLAELDGVPFIMTNPDDDSLFEDLMYQKGLEPDVRFTTTGWRTTYSMVEAGLGVSLCSGKIAENFHGNVVALPLSPRRFLEFGIATPANPSPAVEEFIAVAKQFEGMWPVRPTL